MQGKKRKTARVSRNSRRKQSNQKALPAIPDKRYFTIGEVSKLCGVQPHVLRYWEQEFKSLSPVKRQGNRRYYQQKDILLVRQIRQLLYDKGYTIEGARAQLTSSAGEVSPSVEANAVVKKIIAELENVLQELKTE